MDPKEIVNKLLDDSISVSTKAEILGEYVRWFERLYRSVRSGKRAALNALFVAVQQNSVQDGKEMLKSVLLEVCDHNRRQKREDDLNVRKKANEMRDLSPNTPIVIKDRGGEKVVRLSEVKRTRFVCEFDDGLEYSVPVSFFVRVHDGEMAPRPASKDVERRALIRELAGKHHAAASDVLISNGIVVIHSLLDEFAAADERVKNAPVGLHDGLMNLGMVKKINPRDQALTKRIPPIISEIAARGNDEAVMKMVQNHPAKCVRNAFDGFNSMSA